MAEDKWNVKGLRGSVLEELINYTNEKYRQQKIRKNLHFLKRLAEGVKKGYNKGHDMDTALTGGICRKVSGEMPGADSTDRKTYEESRSCRKF